MPDFLDRLGAELRSAAEAEPERAAAAPRRSARRARRRLRGRRLLLVPATLLIAGAGAAAVATRSGPTPGPVPPLPGAALAYQPEPAQLAAFSILRRGHRAGDPIPLSSRALLSGASGANIALARRASGEGRWTWVVPGRGQMCIVAAWPAHHAGGGVCGGDSEALAGRLFVVTSARGAPLSEFLAGLVPDGVAAVTVHITGRPPATLPVRENVYMGLVDRSVEAVTFTGPHGPVRIEGLNIPLSS